jgi:two-component system CheB/CheR fusion protein
VHPQDRGPVLTVWDAAEASGALQADHRLRNAAEGRYRWVQSHALPMGDETGRIVEWLGTTTDVEDLRRRHEQQQVLIAELQHRARNLLDVVGGIAEQTLAANGSLEDFAASFHRRLAALGRVQGLLSREVEPSVSMEQIVRLELSAHGIEDESDRVRLSGSETMLPARSVQLLALVLHELMTNAIKHGALRPSSCGCVEIAWDERPDGNGYWRQHIEWAETGVAADGTPAAARRGFGRELIEVILPYELDAETRMDFRDDGVRCSIILPLNSAPTGGDLRSPAS